MTLLSPRRYPNSHDAHMRLAETVVLVDNIPVYVNFTKSVNMWCTPLSDTRKDPEELHTSDTRIDLESPLLGWCNLESPWYVSRRPKSSQRQGLVLSNLYLTNNIETIRGIRTTHVNFRALGETIQGTYPDLGLLTERGLGISRAFAILPQKDRFIVLHKTSTIGLYTPKTKTFILSHKLLSKTRKMELTEILLQQKDEYHVTEV